MNLNRYNLCQKILLFLILISLINFCFASDRNELKQLTARRDSLQIKVREAELAKVKLNEIQEIITNLESDLAKVAKMLPGESEIQSLIQQISTFGTKVGLKFLLLQPGEPTSKEDHLEIPVQIKVTGKYHQLGRFLSNIGNLTKIIHIVTLDIKQKEAKYVEAEINAVIYTMPKVYVSIAAGTDIALDIESYKYAPKSRDPFVPLIGTKLSSSKTSHLDLKNLKLTGILWGDQGYYALVKDAQDNVYILKRGDQVAGGQVSEINRQGIIFEIMHAGVVTKYELRLQEEKERR